MHHDTIFRFHYTHTSDKLLVQPVTLGHMHQILQSLWEFFAQALDLIVAAYEKLGKRALHPQKRDHKGVRKLELVYLNFFMG